MAIPIREWVRGEDIFFGMSHIAVGLMAAFAVETIAELPAIARAMFVLAYVVIAFWIYWWLKRTQRTSEREATEARIAAVGRYRQLQADMLEIVGTFVKERYKTDHKLADKLIALSAEPEVDPAAALGIMEEWDEQRREQIKSALGQLCSSLVSDAYLKPTDPDKVVLDQFKVSFYAVTVDPETGAQYLAPEWRYYPAEGAPKTKGFGPNEGAAGKAWSSKEIVVCEYGGEDPQFKNMREGQKADYASMICVPAIEDIPSERMSEVYGVLTVDTPIRAGYFRQSHRQFWALQLQPLCSLLIYCRETKRVKDAFAQLAQHFVVPQKQQDTPVG